ncbi:hypothetical protein OAA62_00295 [bacterium]|nr:hypothetical protein [bacterium]
MNKTKIIISINAFKFEELKRVVKSCTKHVKEEFIIILNNSIELNEEIKNSGWLKDKPYIKLHPTPFNKERFNGGLVKGISSNMNMALRTIFDWEYFIILSNRSEFIKDISVPILKEREKYWKFISKDSLDSVVKKHDSSFVLDPETNKKFSIPFKHRDLVSWNSYKKLPEQFVEEFWEKPSWGGFHEGFTMNKQTCQYILKYLSDQNKANIVYNANNAIEEVFFHTLSINGNGTFLPLKNEVGQALIKDFKNGKYVLGYNMKILKRGEHYVRKFRYFR